MSVKTDVVNLQVNVGNNAAQNQLNELRKKADETRMAMDGLGKRTKEYGAKKAELAGINAEMDKLRKTIGLTALIQTELVQEQKKLLALRNSMPFLTAEWKRYDDQLKQVKNRLYDVNNGVSGFASMWSKVGDEVKKFGLMAAGYLGFQFITSQFASLIKGAGQLSDSLADIQKVTGLTSLEVKSLNEELKKIDTRTSSENLRMLAYEAGKLGIEGKENILGFVKAADMIQVALGEDLGDGATAAIGKIATVYKAIQDFGVEEGLLKVGSAINSVGQSSAATEAYIVEFTKRLGGIAVPANISVAEIIALGGTMDSLGATSEVATTSLGNTIGKMVSDFKGFAQVAGITEDALRKVYSEQGGLGALRAVLQGVQNSGGDFESLVGKLGDIGIEGSRAKAVLGLLANNLGELDRQMVISNQAFAEGTSVFNEFNIKNQTLGATIDKLSKEFNKLIASSAVQNFIKGLIESTFQLIKGFQALPKWINDNTKAVILLAGATAVFTLQAKAATLWLAIESKLIRLLSADISLYTFAAKAGEIATTAWGVVTALFTGNLKKLQAEFKLLKLIMGTNPLGVFLIALGAIALAWTAVENSMKKVINTQKILNDVNKQANDTIAEESGRVMQLTGIIKNQNTALEIKKGALNELIKINPEYLKGLNLENIATAQGTAILERYNKQLFAKAQLEALKGKITDVASRDLNLAEEIRQKEAQLPGADTGYGAGGNKIRSQRDELVLDIKLLKEQRKEVQDEMKGITALQADIMGEQQKVEMDNLNAQKNVMLQRVGMINKELAKYKEDTKEYKKLIAERTFLKQQMIDLYDSKKSGSNSSTTEDQLTLGGTGDITKKVVGKKDANAKKMAELRQQFLEFYGLLKDDIERSGLTEKDVALFNANKAAGEQLNKLTEFFNKGVVNGSEYGTAKNAILNKLESDIAEIEAKYAKPPAGLVTAGKNIAKAIVPSSQQMMEAFGKNKEDFIKALQMADADKLAKLDRNLINAKGSRNEMKAREAVLKEEQRQRTQGLIKGSEERMLIEAEYEQRIAENKKQYILESVQDWLGALQSMANFAQAFIDNRAQKEQNAFNKEKRINDQRKKLLKDQLDNKLISQAVYDKKVAALTEEDDKRKAELQRKQFERAKKMQIIQAIIGGAMAVVSSLAAPPGALDILSLGAARAITIGFAVATTAAQIALISKQQPPEYGKGGGAFLRRGPKHNSKSRGLQVVNPETGQVEALVERGEAIMSSATMDDGSTYTATGTPSQIASTLNGMNGGATWASPAMVRPINSAPNWATAAPARVRGPRMYADGGTMGEAPAGTPNNMQDLTNRLASMDATMQGMRNDIANWNNRLHAVVSIKEYREEEARYDASVASSGL